MRHAQKALAIACAAIVGSALAGCGDAKKEAAEKQEVHHEHDGHDHSNHEGHDHGSHEKRAEESHEGHDHESHEGHNH
jgi:hypothetical protein